jgi:predicted nucleic acid-binding protein
MPGKDRVSPDEALLFLGYVRERLTLTTLSAAEYTDAITDAAARGLVGGGIYDALVSRCALKSRANALYTWNVQHFMRHGPGVAAMVRRP